LSIPDGSRRATSRPPGTPLPHEIGEIAASRALRIFPVLPADWLFGILRYRFGVTMICPQCRSDNCFRSHRDGILDFVLTAAGLRPWRCHSCERRFHAWRVAAILERFAHCPRCGNFDLEDGTLVFVKRWMRFPAYRCDPCRHRFFSVLEFRRIVPSFAESETRRAAN
jgi:hypothetical protein